VGRDVFRCGVQSDNEQHFDVAAQMIDDVCGDLCSARCLAEDEGALDDGLCVQRENEKPLIVSGLRCDVRQRFIRHIQTTSTHYSCIDACSTELMIKLSNLEEPCLEEPTVASLK
jgi:hypothetical protein